MTKCQFSTKLPQISHFHKNCNLLSIIGTFKTNCFYPINFMAGTCKEYTFSFLPVVSREEHVFKARSLFVKTDWVCHVWCNFKPGYTCHGVNILSKMVNHFLSKSSKFCIVWTIGFCSNFTSMWSKYLSNNVWRDFKLQMSALVIII